MSVVFVILGVIFMCCKFLFVVLLNAFKLLPLIALVLAFPPYGNIAWQIKAVICIWLIFIFWTPYFGVGG